MKLTALDVYNKLVDDYNLKSLVGQIKFNLGDVAIIVKRKDIVGNVVQEWLEGWLKDNGIDFLPNENTQMPPDIFLNTSDLKRDWMEVKAFNREADPGFDIADFKAFTKELIEKPYHLDTDFIIFGYKMDEQTGDVIIADVWLKKIWEITRPMSAWPLNLQVKQGVVHKIRPGTWYAKKNRYPMFESMVDFLAAFEETVYQNQDTRSLASQWKNKFKRSYKNHYNKEIDFPRWDDIKNKYILNP